MGTFAQLFVEGKGVPDNKIEDFTEKIKKVFQCGGMMDIVSRLFRGGMLVG